MRQLTLTLIETQRCAEPTAAAVRLSSSGVGVVGRDSALFPNAGETWQCWRRELASLLANGHKTRLTALLALFMPRPDEELNVFACHKSTNVSSAKSPEQYLQHSDEIFFSNRVD